MAQIHRIYFNLNRVLIWLCLPFSFYTSKLKRLKSNSAQTFKERVYIYHFN